MERVLAMVALATLAAGLDQAGEAKFALNGDNTKVTFVGTKPQGRHDGGFKALSGSATINGADVTSLKIAVDIDLNSMWTDTDKLTAHLKSADFFDVKNYPTAKFASSKVEKNGDSYKVTGKLTMHGKSKDVTFPAKIEVKDSNLTLASDFKINRHDWGVSYGPGIVHDDVTLKVSVTAKK
jgi:polyisoprenoid-binding protein YceI